MEDYSKPVPTICLAGCGESPTAEDGCYLVYLVCLVCSVKQDQLDEQNKPDRPVNGLPMSAESA
jgi:hypothetical protein